MTKVDLAMLDSVRKKSDTLYTKTYRNEEFASAEYYVNRKDTTVCQVMKDKEGNIRQVIIANRRYRLFTAEYYANGQIKAILPLDNEGRYNGGSKSFYATGCVKSEGSYQQGFYAGEWKNYKEGGELSSTDIYDSNGQLTKTVPAP